MKVILLSVFCLGAVLAAPKAADTCNKDNCLIEEGCVCASGFSPIEPENTPQFILMSFDDAVTKYIHEEYYQPLMKDRTNPDGSGIKGTFFVPHEYTNYESVHALYVDGHEIGSHSISKNSLTDYWREADKEKLVDEFFGQKEILSHFGNIPIEDIVGVRTPHFQIVGDTSFSAYEEGGFKFDSSWSSPSAATLFPYSLKYKTLAPCPVGQCPVESHDMWVSPINNIKGKDDIECNVLFACNYNGTKAEVKAWLETQLERSYANQRSPLNLLISSAWFNNVGSSFEALQEFVDDVLKQGDVFFVTHSQLIEWRKNPVPYAEYISNNPERESNCNAKVCALSFGEEEIRYMTSCANCPKVYPWLENHLGE